MRKDYSISADWLITGMGEMTKGEQAANGDNVNDLSIESLLGIIAEKDKQLRKLLDIIDDMTAGEKKC